MNHHYFLQPFNGDQPLMTHVALPLLFQYIHKRITIDINGNTFRRCDRLPGIFLGVGILFPVGCRTSCPLLFVIRVFRWWLQGQYQAMVIPPRAKGREMIT